MRYGPYGRLENMMVAAYKKSYHQHHRRRREVLLWEDTGGKGVGAEKSSTSLIQSKRGKEKKKTSGRFRAQTAVCFKRKVAILVAFFSCLWS